LLQRGNEKDESSIYLICLEEKEDNKPMLYITQFIVGGSVMVLASYLSQSKYLFLSGIITLLPILTLLNMRLQIKNMTPETFHAVQANAIYGAVGMIVFTVLVFILSNTYKPTIALSIALGVYILFMLAGKPVVSWIQTTF
jgi:uncharacterized membrane protein (GlpM family)